MVLNDGLFLRTRGFRYFFCDTLALSSRFRCWLHCPGVGYLARSEAGQDSFFAIRFWMMRQLEDADDDG